MRKRNATEIRERMRATNLANRTLTRAVRAGAKAVSVNRTVARAVRAERRKATRAATPVRAATWVRAATPARVGTRARARTPARTEAGKIIRADREGTAAVQEVKAGRGKIEVRAQDHLLSEVLSGSHYADSRRGGIPPHG
ncbi:MAG TPA: hypothetical protein VGS22_29145 [Thermoanaerobaculia bacterium]|nr:hypothetical protein [Thermoanaerobaculia bacterium]